MGIEGGSDWGGNELTRELLLVAGVPEPDGRASLTSLLETARDALAVRGGARWSELTCRLQRSSSSQGARQAESSHVSAAALGHSPPHHGCWVSPKLVQLVLSETSMRGRAWQSIDPIRRSEAVIAEAPMALAVEKDVQNDVCHICLHKAPPLRCEGCAIPVYCSASCRDYAWAQYHHAECHGLSVYYDAVPTAVLLCHRALLVADLPNFETHELVQPLRRRWQFALHAVLAESTLPDWTAAHTVRFFSLLCARVVNVIAITDLKHEPMAACAAVPLVRTTQRRLAQALYRHAMMLNHACAPNAHLEFDGSRLVVRATSDLPVAVELTHCYGPHVSTHTREERHRLLSQQYHFSCECDACGPIASRSVLSLSGRRRAFVCAEGCAGAVVPDSSKLVCTLCGAVKTDDEVSDMVRRSNEALKVQREAVEAIRNDPHSALKLGLRSLALQRQQLLHPSNPLLAESHDCVAQAYATLGDFGAAADHCESAVRTLRHSIADADISMAHELLKLAQLQAHAGRHSDAQRTVQSLCLGKADQELDSAVRLELSELQEFLTTAAAADGLSRNPEQGSLGPLVAGSEQSTSSALPMETEPDLPTRKQQQPIVVNADELD